MECLCLKCGRVEIAAASKDEVAACPKCGGSAYSMENLPAYLASVLKWMSEFSAEVARFRTTSGSDQACGIFAGRIEDLYDEMQRAKQSE